MWQQVILASWWQRSIVKIGDAAHPSGGLARGISPEPLTGSVFDLQASGQIARWLDQHP